MDADPGLGSRVPGSHRVQRLGEGDQCGPERGCRACSGPCTGLLWWFPPGWGPARSGVGYGHSDPRLIHMSGLRARIQAVGLECDPATAGYLCQS